MNLVRRGLFAVLALPLAACAIGPSTRVQPAPAAALKPAPRPPAERAFFDSLVSSSSVAAMPAPLVVDTVTALGWLAVLRDSQLVALVRTALDNNRELQAATARVREYRALYGVARADFFPRLDANASASRNRVIFGAFPASYFGAVRATADMQWELDFWGRIRRSSEASRFDWMGREEDRQAVVLSLVSDVVSAYLDLRELDEDVRISEQTLATRDTTLRLARQRFGQGLISELDVRQFEAQVALPAAAVAQFTRRRAEQENRLNLLLGRSPGNVPRGTSIDAAVRAVSVPDSVPSSLLARRPDVLRAQSDWSAALARIGVAQAARLPRVAITGTYGYQRPDFSGLFQSGAEVYSVQAGISVPLFAGGRLVSQQRAAAARADQARARYEQAVLTALGEASDALTGLRLSRDELAALETQSRALRRALELALRRYQSGVSSYFEVLDVQRGLFAAELALVQAQRDYLGATVQLYKALGGVWVQ